MKLSLIMVIVITSLNAGSFTNPLGSAFKSTDNGGTLPAIDAYKDGIGVIILDNQGTGFQIDNSAMNTLVYKYGELAKNNNTGLETAVLNDPDATTKDKNLLLTLTNISSGTVSIPAPQPIALNISQNGLYYDNCEGGEKNWVDAKAYCESKSMRLPNLNEIYSAQDAYRGPACPVSTTGYSWTATSNAFDSYYRWEGSYASPLSNNYKNNIEAVRCVAKFGEQCDDGIAGTNNSYWKDGICKEWNI